MNHPPRRVCGLAIAMLALTGSVYAAVPATDTTTTTQAEAIARLEAAQQAFAAAQAELAAAQAELAQYADASTTTSTSETASSQPADEAANADNEAAAKAARKLAWNEGWESTFYVGISGSSGNTENFSGRAALTGERKTDTMETKLHASYLYATSDGTQSASRGELGIHNDWLLEGPWRYFAQGKYEYDEFQAWQHRLSAAVGVGYEFIQNDKTSLVGRAGLGGSYEMGKNAEEKLIPEGLLGLDWSYQLSSNSKLVATTTYYPSFDDWGEFRWNSGAGIEVTIDAESGMTMNAGIEHRHDSNPGAGIRPNDVDYYMGVGWKF